MIRKQLYETPEVERIEIVISSHVLDGSFGATRSTYGTPESDTWGEGE